MKAAVRLILTVVVLVAGMLVHDSGKAAPPQTLGSARLLDAASLKLVHQRPASVIRWLRRQSGVASADIGEGAETVDIRLRNGLQAAIFVRTPGPAGTSALPRRVPALRPAPLRPLDAPSGAQRRALILLPFASDMGLYEHGQKEAALLQHAGFAVDQVYDSNVTLATMATISHYDLVYMITHSGVNQGEGLVATGEQVDPNHVDPALFPLIQEGSIMITGVAGSTLHYWGVRSRFFAWHLDGPFPHNSLVFFNGCWLLQASALWQALNADGVATMLAWDGLTLTLDYAPTGEDFFNQMTRGDTVQAALSALQADGHATSNWAGSFSHLGFLGDSTLTLDGRSSATPTPTNTPAPTSTPLPTSTPAPTATLPPPSLSVKLKRTVRPGERQVITATTGRNITVRFRVVFPNGASRHAVRRTGSTGKVRYAYMQPAHETTPGHRTAKVVVRAVGAAGDTIVTKTYRILRR